MKAPATILCQLGVIAALALQAAPAAAGADQLTITGLRAPVLMHLPLASVWQVPRAGQVVADGTILEVGEGGTLDLLARFGKPTGGADVTATKIRVAQPGMLRFDQNAFRRIRLTPRMLLALPNTSEQAAWLKRDTLFKDLLAAWYQDALLLLGNRSSEAAGLSAADSKSTGAGNALKITEPADLDKVSATRLPVEIDLRWRASGVPPDQEYLVYAWGVSQPRKLYGRVRGRAMKVLQHQGGLRFFQVETADHRRTSMPITVLLVVDKTLATTTRTATKEPTGGRKSRLISLLSPPRSLALIGGTRAPSLEFSWDRPDGVRGECSFILTVRRPGGAAVVEQRTSRTSLLVHAEFAGKLTWSVRAEVCKVDGAAPVAGLWQSEARTLDIQPSRGVREDVRALLRNPAGGTYVMGWEAAR